MVEGPAAVAGLTVDPDLVDAVVRDVAGQAAALPLLSSALVGTWERRRGATLTLAGYLEAGGVTGALARTAEAALADLDDQGKALARRLLVRLAAAGEAGAAVRRRAAITELGFTGAEGQVRRAVIEAFVSRRLLTIDVDHLEVTHEALLTAWPRLARWLAEDAAGRAVRTHLAPEASDWDTAARPEDRLYRGARLVAAQDWLARPDADPTPTERDFVAASTARAEAELADARAQTQRERAGRRRTRRLAAVLAATTIIAAAAGGLALQKSTQAKANALRADANRLAAASANAPSLDTSLLLAAEAYRTEHTPQTEDGLLAADVGHRQGRGRVPGRRHHPPHRRQPRRAHPLRPRQPGGARAGMPPHTSSTSSPDTAARTNSRPTSTCPPPPADRPPGPSPSVTPPVPGKSRSSTMSLLWPDGRARWTLSETDLGGWPVAVEFTADGTRVAAEVVEGYGGSHPAIQHLFVDAQTGTPRRIGPRSPISADIAYDLWVSSLAEGARTVVVGDTSRLPGVLDVARGTTTWLDTEGREILGASFFAVTGGVLEAADDGAMYWYPNAATRKAQKLSDHTSQVLAAATDATGTVLVTGGSDHRVVVDRLEGGTWVTSEVFTGHQGTIREVAVSPDGRRAFSTSDDGTVIEWDLTDKARFGSVIPWIPDPDDADPSPIVIGKPAVVGQEHTWVVPIVTRVFEEAREPEMLAGFMDPATGKILDWVPIGARPPVAVPSRRPCRAGTDGGWR